MKWIVAVVIGMVIGFAACLATVVRYCTKEMRKTQKAADKNRALFDLLTQWIAAGQRDESIPAYLKEHGYKKVAIYGMADMGKLLYAELQDSEVEVAYVVDRRKNLGIGDPSLKVYHKIAELPPVDAVIVTALFDYNKIANEFYGKYNFDVLSIEEIIADNKAESSGQPEAADILAKNPRVGVVLVNYNGQRFIRQCLESLRAQTYDNHFVVFVDNASTDFSLKVLDKYRQNEEVIRLSQNMGFAEGNNVGVKRALELGADYVMLLNTDTNVDTRLIEILLSETDETTVIAPKMFSDSAHRNVWFAGGNIDYKTGMVEHFHEASEEERKRREVSFLTGCCLLMHRSVWEKVGGLSTEFFLYCEDTDFCVRCKKNGIRLLYTPHTWLWHKVGGSGGGEMSPRMIYYITRNTLLLVKKHKELFGVDVRTLAKETWKQSAWMTYGRRKSVAVGIRDYVFHRTGCRNYNFF